MTGARRRLAALLCALLAALFQAQAALHAGHAPMGAEAAASPCGCDREEAPAPAPDGEEDGGACLLCAALVAALPAEAPAPLPEVAPLPRAGAPRAPPVRAVFPLAYAPSRGPPVPAPAAR